MVNGKSNRDVVQVRNEVLVALKMVYPTALQAQQLLRSLLSLFPTLEWEQFRRDLCYLTEKSYVQRIVSDSESDETLTPWRHRWFRLTTTGLELADRLIGDPAMEP